MNHTVNQKSTPYCNPIFQHDAPDPSGVIKGPDGCYYVMTTQSVYDNRLITLPILRSKDLVHWELAGQVFEELPAWVSQKQPSIWAPDLIAYQGKYYVYYSAKTKDNDKNIDMAIGVAIADHPLGPYTDKGEPILAGPSFTTIDSFILTDTDGTRYFYWGSGHEPIKVQKLSQDGLHLVGDPVEVLQVNRDAPYERLLEAAWVVKRGECYYLFVSGDNCCGKNANYAVMVARSNAPLGPFVKLSDAGGGPILAANKHFNAPGHNSIVTDEAGQDWILYHAIDRRHPEQGRMLMIDKINWTNGWPVINDGNGPTNELQLHGPVT